MAERTGIDQAAISRIERGSTRPTEKTLPRIAGTLDAGLTDEAAPLAERASSSSESILPYPPGSSLPALGYGSDTLAIGRRGPTASLVSDNRGLGGKPPRGVLRTGCQDRCPCGAACSPDDLVSEMACRLGIRPLVPRSS
ncbi:MAG: helix-turn-helix domain-containing protein [Acidimicrobiales bacterium]